MPDNMLKSFSPRVLNGALLAIGCLVLAATPALAQTKNPDREAYFGETHVHTSWSLDAWLIGNRLTDPGDAYKYFKGEPIKHPLGYDVKIDTPLDWAGVTDHSEYVGVIKLANDPTSPISKLSAAQPLRINPDKPAAEEVQRIFEYGVRVLMGGPPVKALMSPEVAGTVWKENVALAEKANQPGKFTAFCSYEWTAMPSNMNLHRNIFFKDCAKVPPLPFSALDSPIRWTSGTGWMASGRPATTCWPSRTTPTYRTAACTRPRSTPRAARSMPPMPSRAFAMSP